MRPRIIIIGAILLGLLVIGGVFVALSGKNDKQGSQKSAVVPAAHRAAGDKFMGYLTSTNAASSYAMLSDNMKATTPEDQWRTEVATNFADFTGKAAFDSVGTLDARDSSYEKDAKPHLLVYRLTINNVRWKTSFVVFLDKGEWRIDALRSYQQ